MHEPVCSLEAGAQVCEFGPHPKKPGGSQGVVWLKRSGAECRGSGTPCAVACPCLPPDPWQHHRLCLAASASLKVYYFPLQHLFTTPADESTRGGALAGIAEQSNQQRSSPKSMRRKNKKNVRCGGAGAPWAGPANVFRVPRLFFFWRAPSGSGNYRGLGMCPDLEQAPNF